MNIVNDFVPAHIIVKLKFPNQRAYEIAWSLALLNGYDDFDEFVNDLVIDRLDMYVEGRNDLDDIEWGFKTREQREMEEEKRIKVS
jgi:hypothetical protein